MKNHNSLFEEAQDKYFETKSESYLVDLYNIIFDLAKNYIKNYGSKRRVHIQDIDIKAHDVATLIIERKFIKDKGERIKKLTSYIYWDCYHEIVKDYENDKLVELKDF